MSDNGGGAGIAAELGLGPLHVGAEIGMELGKHMKSMARSLEVANRLLQPARYPILNSVNTGASPGPSPFLVRIPSAVGSGSPGVGRVWQVIKVGLFGSDDHTAVAAVTASIYCGPVSGNLGGASVADLASCIASNVTIPFVDLIGKDRVWMENGYELYAWIYGAAIPANQQFSLTASIDDYPVLAKEALAL